MRYCLVIERRRESAMTVRSGNSDVDIKTIKNDQQTTSV